MANIFTCRRPNRLGVGAIDHLDKSEQVPDKHGILDVTEKSFTDQILMIHRRNTLISSKLIGMSIIRNPKVTSSLRTFGHLGFSKDSDTQNYLYHNENLFRSIDMMRVLFDENYF